MQAGSVEGIDRRLFLRSSFVGGMFLAAESAKGMPSAETHRPAGNAILGERGGMHHVAILTNDWDGTLNFYKQGLGFSVKMLWNLDGANNAGYLDSGNGACVEVFYTKNFAPLHRSSESSQSSENSGESKCHNPIVHICLQTTRLDAAFENAIHWGAKPVSGPKAVVIKTTTGQGDWPVRLAFLEGPNGEAIELLEHAP